MRVTYPLINQPEEQPVEIRKKKKSGWASSLHQKMMKRIPGLSQFKSNPVRSKTYGYGYSYYSENYFLEKNRIKLTSDVDRVLQMKQKDIDFVSQTNIAPLSLEFPLSMKDIKGKLGEPDFVLNNQEKISGHEMLFYKIKSWKYKMNYQFHFFNGSLFYVNVEFSNLDFSNLHDRNKILQMVIEKYMEKDCAEYVKQFPVVLSDTEQNKLIISRELNVNLHYFSNDVVLNRQLDELLQQVVLKKMNKYNVQKNNFMKIL